MWGERQRNVLVRGKSHDVSVYQKSKSVWIAVGDYMGARQCAAAVRQGTTAVRCLISLIDNQSRAHTADPGAGQPCGGAALAAQ
jgi:hypothetical protein